MKLCLRCNQYFEDTEVLCPQDQAPLESVGKDPLIGALISDRYVVESVIGKGSSGIVYKARRMQRGEMIVAVKVLHSFQGAGSGTLDKFLREARAASRLRNPHIITIWDSGVTDDGQPYFVMDYLEGVTVADLIQEREFLFANRAFPIIRQICDALTEAHKQGIIHRDLKPENVVLQETDYGDDYVKLLDFGIAESPYDSLKQKLEKVKMVAGSPAYMSPEQCQGLELDARSDIYSLAVMTFEMLTGERPLQSDDHKSLMFMQVGSPPMRLADIRPDLNFPAKLEEVLARALSKKPVQRQASVKEYWVELEASIKDTEFAELGAKLKKTESVKADGYSVPEADRLTRYNNAPSGVKQSGWGFPAMPSANKTPAAPPPMPRPVGTETVILQSAQAKPLDFRTRAGTGEPPALAKVTDWSHAVASPAVQPPSLSASVAPTLDRTQTPTQSVGPSNTLAIGPSVTSARSSAPAAPAAPVLDHKNALVTGDTPGNPIQDKPTQEAMQPAGFDTKSSTNIGPLQTWVSRKGPQAQIMGLTNNGDKDPSSAMPATDGTSKPEDQSSLSGPIDKKIPVPNLVQSLLSKIAAERGEPLPTDDNPAQSSAPPSLIKTESLRQLPSQSPMPLEPSVVPATFGPTKFDAPESLGDAVARAIDNMILPDANSMSRVIPAASGCNASVPVDYKSVGQSECKGMLKTEDVIAPQRVLQEGGANEIINRESLQGADNLAQGKERRAEAQKAEESTQACKIATATGDNGTVPSAVSRLIEAAKKSGMARNSQGRIASERARALSQDYASSTFESGMPPVKAVDFQSSSSDSSTASLSSLSGGQAANSIKPGTRPAYVDHSEQSFEATPLAKAADPKLAAQAKVSFPNEDSLRAQRAQELQLSPRPISSPEIPRVSLHEFPIDPTIFPRISQDETRRRSELAETSHQGSLQSFAGSTSDHSIEARDGFKNFVSQRYQSILQRVQGPKKSDDRVHVTRAMATTRTRTLAMRSKTPSPNALLKFCLMLVAFACLSTIIPFLSVNKPAPTVSTARTQSKRDYEEVRRTFEKQQEKSDLSIGELDDLSAGYLALGKKEILTKHYSDAVALLQKVSPKSLAYPEATKLMKKVKALRK